LSDIGVILGVESLVQIAALDPEIFDLSARQILLGAPLTFTLYLAGAVLPAMVFIYAILVPRFLLLTGSTAATVILGGLTYTALHVWDAWTVFDSPGNAALSVVFLILTYFAPGMFKTVLTVRPATRGFTSGPTTRLRLTPWPIHHTWSTSFTSDKGAPTIGQRSKDRVRTQRSTVRHARPSR
jgi:hypothetical protein